MSRPFSIPHTLKPLLTQPFAPPELLCASLSNIHGKTIFTHTHTRVCTHVCTQTVCVCQATNKTNDATRTHLYDLFVGRSAVLEEEVVVIEGGPHKVLPVILLAVEPHYRRHLSKQSRIYAPTQQTQTQTQTDRQTHTHERTHTHHTRQDT
jgi:hypothetical protein